MPEYLTPGTYVEEVGKHPRTIEGVPTSTVGAVGVTERGPTHGPPVLVASFDEFATVFGDGLAQPEQSVAGRWANDPDEGGRLWHFSRSIRGFFDNGGCRIYIKRVVPADAEPDAAWTDACERLSIADFVGFDGGPGQRYGIHALADIDEISLCIVPGVWSLTVRSALLRHCQSRRDRFAILDLPDGLDAPAALARVEAIDTSFAATYHPWVEVGGPAAGGVAVGPSGHVAGVFARVDANHGVHKAPAGEVIHGIRGLARHVRRANRNC